MKNKVFLCGWFIVLMAFGAAFGVSNARYFSAASMTRDFDYKDTIKGKISIYNPNWLWGYEGASDGSGFFKVERVSASQYDNIHYQVTNKNDSGINEEETDYYIRVVAEDGSNDIPIEYDVHEYKEDDSLRMIYPLETGVGYGPFTLSANTENTTYYSIRANWTSNEAKYKTGIQHLKVQMVKKRSDGTPKVMSEAPLNMKYTGLGGSEDKVYVKFAYFIYGQWPAESVGTSHTLDMGSGGVTIDFEDNNQLADLGIILPSGHTFYTATYNFGPDNVNWDGTKTVTIPSEPGGDYRVEVYLIKDPTSVEKATVNLSYYESSVDGTSLGSQTLASVSGGVKIDFKDSSSLSDLGINLPSGYKFNNAYCSELDSTGAGWDDFTIPNDCAGKTYNINVVLDKVETPPTTITVPVKFYKDGVADVISSTTVDMKEDGTYDFTTAKCRELCPALSDQTSFTVYIANQWGSTREVGNTKTPAGNVVTIDYNKTYTSWVDFKLTDAGSYIYIKAWG